MHLSAQQDIWSSARRCGLALALAGLAGCAGLPPPNISLHWAGTYTLGNASQTEDPRALTGMRTRATRLHPDRRTNDVTASLGTGFGIAYSFDGFRNERIFHRVVLHYPEPITNPKTGRTATGAESEFGCYAGEECRVAHVFTEEWELKPGPWVVEVWVAEHRLARQVFNVRRVE